MPGAFQLSEMDVTLSEINVLMAVALRDFRFFRTTVDTPISNLFYNYAEPEVDLLVPMTAKYIYQRANRDYLIFKVDDLKNARAIAESW